MLLTLWKSGPNIRTKKEIIIEKKKKFQNEELIEETSHHDPEAYALIQVTFHYEQIKLHIIIDAETVGKSRQKCCLVTENHGFC